MPLFDRYIAVDWSAANTPRRGRDSIWIGELGPEGCIESENPPTRHEAMASVTRRLLEARSVGERVMLGFDFAFGYPRGAADAIASAMSDPSNPLAGTSPLTGKGGRGGVQPRWTRLWSTIARLVIDNPDNTSNRFHVAAAINRSLAAPHYWGHPHQHRYEHLWPRRPSAYAAIPERRRAEIQARTAQSVWKLTGAGAVGSQSMLGIARLEALRRHPVLGPGIAVWPFETSFVATVVRPVTIVEIYPSLLPLDDPGISPKDRAQVETCVRHFAALDSAGELGSYLAAPKDLASAERQVILDEEGWIAGIGHDRSQLRSAA
jgi:precorrin-8X/cobalt-precorrin-8 methylmutase